MIEKRRKETNLGEELDKKYLIHVYGAQSVLKYTITTMLIAMTFHKTSQGTVTYIILKVTSKKWRLIIGKMP